ncbi:hypothetical protein NQZ68_002994 [Dissostichus eleginoides]|nr:hypothetical protein NQZ68_002994 [Dissostichus eleginoides]
MVRAAEAGGKERATVSNCTGGNLLQKNKNGISKSINDCFTCLISFSPFLQKLSKPPNAGHAIDAVTTCRPDWQARLLTDEHARQPF